MAILPADIKFYESKSDGTADGEATGDGLGGYRSSDQITTNVLNNVWDDVAGADSLSGDTEYRAIFVKNTHGSLTLVSAKTWIDVDMPNTTLTTELVNAGSETTVYVVSTTDFPDSGAFFVEDEEISYTGKTASTFTGAARGSNGTSKVLHVVTTRVEHNQIRIAVEAPTSKTTGYISEIINESTAPGGISFTANYTYDTGLSVTSLAPSEFYGIWIRRKVPLGCGPKSGIYGTIKVMGNSAE